MPQKPCLLQQTLRGHLVPATFSYRPHLSHVRSEGFISESTHLSMSVAMGPTFIIWALSVCSTRVFTKFAWVYQPVVSRLQSIWRTYKPTCFSHNMRLKTFSVFRRRKPPLQTILAGSSWWTSIVVLHASRRGHTEEDSWLVQILTNLIGECIRIFYRMVEWTEGSRLVRSPMAAW